MKQIGSESYQAGEDFQEADRRQTLCDPSRGRQREQSDEDHGDAGSEKSVLQLIVDVRGESEEASDEDGYGESRTSAHTGGCAGSEGVSVVV